MTKKFLLAFIPVILLISPIFSAESDYPIDEQFTESIAKFAQNIMNHNEHAFEQKLVGKQLEFSEWESNVTKRYRAGWNRVWAKGKTITVGTAMNTKKEFHLDYFITADPDYTFAGGIHVGSSVRDLERYLKTKLLNRPSDYNGGNLGALDVHVRPGYINFYYYEFTGADRFLKFFYSNSIITQIGYFEGGYFATPYSMSKKTEAFVKSKMKSMGLREFPEANQGL